MGVVFEYGQSQGQDDTGLSIDCCPAAVTGAVRLPFLCPQRPALHDGIGTGLCREQTHVPSEDKGESLLYPNSNHAAIAAAQHTGSGV